jgi:dethiobiotin synthetase
MPRVRGITVVGCGLDSGETLVAAAACAAARTTGEDPRLFVTAALGPAAEAESVLVAAVAGQPFTSSHVLRTAASPAIAAHHAGTQLDPGTLVAAAREAADAGLLVAAAPGGLLAPLTEHYSNRDFARELGLPLVIAARAAGGVAGQVRVVGDAARSAGLTVVAVFLTGWPDPPNRVQLDERELLTRLARVPVLTLAESARSADSLAEAGSGWPVLEWSAAAEPAADAPVEPITPAPTVPAGANGAAVTLDPYDAWQPHQVGDPRNTPRPKIMQTMLEIIEAEGPMTASRAYSLYNRAAGGRKLTSVARAPLSSAIYWLAREEKITLTREADIPWQGGDMVRLPDQPPVRARELGPRSLDEVPLDEIAELVKLLRAAAGTTDPTALKRAILNTYGLIRLTGRADEYLGLAIDLAS